VSRALLVLLLVVAGCGFETRSQEYACQVAADCGDRRICRDGWCVLGSDDIRDAGADADAPTPCPAACTECTAAGVCRVACDRPGDCEGLVCPPGMPCAVSCTGVNSCDGIDCRAASSCAIECSRDGSCESAILCGDGPCTIACTGDDTCASGVDCSSSCECAVDCDGAGACDAEAECPAPECEGGDGGCDPEDGAACASCAP
jgi:hypothetical protein